MKRLLLPLLPALALPIGVNAGDLGIADINPERTKGIIADVEVFSRNSPKGYRIDLVICGMDLSHIIII